jgi:hypothetical protein
MPLNDAVSKWHFSNSPNDTDLNELVAEDKLSCLLIYNHADRNTASSNYLFLPERFNKHSTSVGRLGSTALKSVEN